MTCNQNCNQGRACECGYIIDQPDAPIDRLDVVITFFAGICVGGALTLICVALGRAA